jgi:spore germination protein YaaH
VTDLRQPSAATNHRSAILVVTAMLTAALLLPATSASAGVPSAAPDRLGVPSIQYEEARQHERDANPFVPSAARELAARVPLRARAAPPPVVHGVLPSASRLRGSSSGLRREVFGFLPYWQLSDPSTNLNYATLSTIAYFSVAVDRNGNLVKTNSDGTTATGWGGWTSSQLTNVINAAHQRGVRVVLCVTLFGWSSTEAAAQGAMLGSATARAALAQQAAIAVGNRGADGINLDFEPIVSGHSDDFTALVRAIRAELDARAPGSLLTFDATAEVGNYPVADATAAGGADAIFVMGYDYRTADASAAGSVAPLNGPLYDISDTLAAYLARTSASKLILGIPYYGRAWSTVSDALNAKTQSGTKYGSSTAVPYANAVDIAEQNSRRYDAIEESAWTAYQRQNCTSTYGCVTSWRQLYYDDPQSLGAKYNLVNRLGLRGVGMWALGYDGTRPELARVLADKFVNDTTPPVAGIVALAPSQGSESFTVTWAAIDDLSGVVGIDVDVSVDGGPWTSWLTGTTATSATYQGASGHTFAFRVRATDGLGHTGTFAPADTGSAGPGLTPGGFAQVAVDALQVRAAPDPNAQSVASLNVGSLVAISGGPVAAGGYTWYQITEPIREWPAVSPVLVGVWVASGSAATSYLTAVPPPNTTVVAASGPDTTPPILKADLVTPPFISPNGDGRLDTAEVRGTALGGSIWTLLISPAADLTGAPTRTIAGSGETIAATWDGRGDAGTALPDGPYRLRLVAADAAGNQAAQEWIVQLDTAPPALKVLLSPDAFSPNGDGYAETTKISITVDESITGAIEIFRGAASVRRFVLGASDPLTLTWDGRDEAKRVVADGKFVVQVSAADSAGNSATRRLVLAVDRTASLLRWSPGRFAPKQGATSTVGFNLSRAATTTLLVRGPNGRSVRTAWANRIQRAGRLPWTWDGRDGRKHTVAPGTYVAVLVVRTAIGMTTIMRSVVVQ